MIYKKMRHRPGRIKPNLHGAVCAECGVRCDVPFSPSQKRPVFCKKCLRKMNK